MFFPRQLTPCRITAIIAVFLLSQTLLLLHAHGDDAGLSADPAIHGCLLCASSAVNDLDSAPPPSETWTVTAVARASAADCRSASALPLFCRGPQSPRAPPLPLR